MRGRSVLRTRIRLVAGLSLLSALSASLANSQPTINAAPVVLCKPDPDRLCIVSLRAGGILVGRLEELLPGERLGVRLGAHDLRQVAWADIASAVPAADTPSGVAPVPQPLGPPDAGRIATAVQVAGMRDGMSLQARMEDDRWRTVCDEPCTAPEIEPGGTFRFVQTDGLKTEFKLPMAQRLRIDTRPGRYALRTSGLALLIVGSAALVIGAITTSIQQGIAQSDAGARPFAGQLAGGLLLSVGAAMGTAGIVMTVTGGAKIKLQVLDPSQVR